MRIRIDETRCTGHGRCYTLAPDLFDTDDSGYGVVTRPDVPPELIGQAEFAVKSCPENAVVLEDA